MKIQYAAPKVKEFEFVTLSVLCGSTDGTIDNLEVNEYDESIWG